MKDYTERIKGRAKICEVELTYDQLTLLNQKVNDDINRGVHEFDALDYAYMYIKKLDVKCSSAKDKANELVEKFYQNSPEIMGTARAMEFGVNMALIVVDEIIKSDPIDWNEVKNELQSLQ